MTYRIWAEVWNATETTAYGMINLSALSVERRLDGMGTIRLEMPIQDTNAQLFSIGRIVRIFTTHPYGDKRRVITAYLQKSSIKVTPAGESVVWEAVDRFEELRRLTTHMARAYSGYTVEDALRDLMLLAPAWSVYTQDIEGDTALRFDGTKVLNALVAFAETHGYHFRLGAVDRQLVFGSLGADSGIRATNIRQPDVGIDSVGDVFLFDRLELISDGGEIVNWICPLMGNNEAYITGYTWANEVGGIGGIVPNIIYSPNIFTDGAGNSNVYLTDATSVATYGQRQDYIFADKLYPIGGAIEASAILYLWAQNWLVRHKDPQTVYRLSLTKWADKLQVGDKLKVVYRGEVYQDGVKVRYADINADLWILKMNERYTVTGATLDVEVSAVDIFPPNPADIIAGSVETQKRRVAMPELRMEKTTFSDSSTVDNVTPGELEFSRSALGLSVARATLTMTRLNASTGPSYLEVRVNGILMGGGPFLMSGLTDTVDLRSLMTTSTVTDYTIEVSCLYGSGTLELDLELWEVLGAIV